MASSYFFHLFGSLSTSVVFEGGFRLTHLLLLKVLLFPAPIAQSMKTVCA